MRVHIPDPEYTASDRARTSFRLALKLALGFVVVVWLIDIANWALGLELQRHGIHPRELAGLAGIVFAPLLHGGPFHLAANTTPLLVLGAAMLHLYPSSALKVTATCAPKLGEPRRISTATSRMLPRSTRISLPWANGGS